MFEPTRSAKIIEVRPYQKERPPRIYTCKKCLHNINNEFFFKRCVICKTWIKLPHTCDGTEIKLAKCQDCIL